MKEWIDEIGTVELSQLLDTTTANVRAWRLDYWLPTARQMRNIKRLSKGRVSYDMMIDGYFERKAKRNKSGSGK